MNKIVDNKSGKTDIHKGVDAIAVKSRIRHLIIPEQIINFTQQIFRELYFSPSLSRLCHSSLDLWLSLLLRVTAPVSILSNLDIFMSMCLLVQISALVSVDKTIIVIMTVRVVCDSHMFRPVCLSSCHDRRCTGPPTSAPRPRAPRSRPSSSCWRRRAGAG